MFLKYNTLVEELDLESKSDKKFISIGSEIKNVRVSFGMNEYNEFYQAWYFETKQKDSWKLCKASSCPIVVHKKES